MSTKTQLVIATFAVAVTLLLNGSVVAQERTVEEFKTYVEGKLGGQLSDSQLDAVAKLVDADGDGEVSESEFETRMDAIASVMSGEAAEPSDSEGPSEEEGLKQKPVPVVDIPALSDSTDATVLLITGDEIAEAWLPFAKWKTQNGKLTKIVTVGQIDRDFEASSIQEKIRLCVRKHIEEHGTKWVVLGGDCLPGGKGLVPGGHTTVHVDERKGIPTDIVYLSKTNWDADGDGIFGEFDDDREAISYPDGSVGLGRIPVRTAQQVAAFTEKVVAYEMMYPTGDFAKNMIYTCTDSPAYPKVRNSWDGYVSKVWEGNVGRFFSKETPWDEEGKPGSYPLSSKNLIELFNQKSTSKLHIHGHGHLPAWLLEKSEFTGKHVANLKNERAYPLITTVSCNTGEYDSKKDPSIVERMLRAPKAGSVAIVAPIRTGKPHFADPDDYDLMVSEGKLDGTTLTMTRYWSFGLGENATTGHAIMKAKQAMAKDAAVSEAYHLCVCELNLLGDPTLDMRAETPKTPTLNVTTSELIKGSRRITIVTDAPNCKVCLWQDGKLHRTTKANDKGVASLFVEQQHNLSSIMFTVSGASLNSVSQKGLSNE